MGLVPALGRSLPAGFGRRPADCRKSGHRTGQL